MESWLQPICGKIMPLQWNCYNQYTLSRPTISLIGFICFAKDKWEAQKSWYD